MKRRLAHFAAAAALLAGLPACGKDIGDDCSSSVDCAQDGTRLCDLAQPGGYCTIDGCDQSSCPGGSLCIRFFPVAFLTKPCDPAGEDVPGGRDDCSGDELCLDEGLCAPAASERRYCAKGCGGNDDCRSGYECQVAGTKGSMALTRSGGDKKFCGPR